MKEIEEGNIKVLSDLREIVKIKDFLPKNPHDIMKEVMVSCYMGTKNSSSVTKSRAKSIA